MFTKNLVLLLVSYFSIIPTYAMENYIHINEHSVPEPKKEIATLNRSLLRVALAMQKLNYQVKIIDVESLVTDDNGKPILDENNNVKKELKDALQFSKGDVPIVTFTLDGTAPADHDLWVWSGCDSNEKTNDDDKISFYLDLIGFNNYKYTEKVSISDYVKDLISVNDTQNIKFFRDLFKQMLTFPEGKMLMYSVFLNQSEIIKMKSLKDSSIVFKNVKPVVIENLRNGDLAGSCRRIEVLTKYEKYATDVDKIYTPRIYLKLYTTGRPRSCYEEYGLCGRKIFVIPEALKSLSAKDRRLAASKMYRCFSDDYQGRFFLKNTCTGYENMLVLFHEMCHFLSFEGRNKLQYTTEYPDKRELNNGALVVKYWEEFFNIPKEDYIYSKNEVKLLLNDFLRYDNLWELLVTAWNNRGKDYFGNNLYTNLISYRVSGRICSEHSPHRIPTLNSVNLKSSDISELSTSFSNVCRRNCINQMRSFKSLCSDNALLKIKYTPSMAKPLEITGNSHLLINSPGYQSMWVSSSRYSVLNLKTKNDFDKLEDKELRLYAPDLKTDKFSSVSLMDNIDINDLYVLFVAHDTVDENMKKNCSRDELVDLIGKVLMRIRMAKIDIDKKSSDQNERSRILRFVSRHIYKVLENEKM